MKNLRIPILLMLFGALAMTGGVSFDSFSLGWSVDDQPVVEWVAAHAVRLQTPAAGHGFADMHPLKKMIGNARIVSLGEATHGTREFFQLKHRMLEFLATEMGFTIFSIEANMPEAYQLNDFVLNGKGDPAKLIKGMYFWTWDTQEVLDMVLWMREFNKSGKGRVQFTGFDMQFADVAAGIVSEFVEKSDQAYTASVRQAIDQSENAAVDPSFGGATTRLPVTVAAGKRLRISGYVKTEGVTPGSASLWGRVDGASGVLAGDSTLLRGGATGTADWKKWEIEIPVALDAANIDFGVLLDGHGTVWFDSLAIEMDGKPYVDPSPPDLDLDFESPSPKGFFTYGNGYQVQMDAAVFHTGKQSLQIRNAGAGPHDAKSVGPKLASSAWKDIVRHLEASREAYAKKGAPARDIEWVIQNARVVLQCMQLRADEVPRDRSMADNVKWILDTNPGAKIVLWAHNGHVSTASAGGNDPMGASLRKVYGGQMVAFGFAFNHGAFQAIEQSKGVLRDFTVPPAPAGSLDATLAATGIPLFALDLRDAPKSGPVAAWLSESHKTRSIGAVYSEDSAAQSLFALKAFQSFDAILFVEKTTAARKNP
jgi:erythromycin esterase-like protein